MDVPEQKLHLSLTKLWVLSLHERFCSWFKSIPLHFHWMVEEQKLTPLTVQVFDNDLGMVESKLLSILCLCNQGTAAVYFEKVECFQQYIYLGLTALLCP